MALSNWDTFAVDVTGACDGGFAASQGDVSVEIYKNWLSVRSPSLWHEGCGFSEPVVATVEEGRLKIGAVQMLARRGPSDGVYCCLWESVYGRDGEGNLLPGITRTMAGIGIYGFVDEEWVGVTDEHLTFLAAMIREGLASYDLPREFAELDLGAGRRFNQGDVFFAGVFGVETPTAEVGDPGQPLFDDALEGFKARHPDFSAEPPLSDLDLD